MFKTMAEVRQANQAIGNTWFSDDNMRFFHTLIESKLYAGRYFITSDAMTLDSVRKYSVREADKDGRISTIGEFHSYLTLEDAEDAIQSLLGR